MKQNETPTENLSKSKQRKLERANQRAAAKKADMAWRIGTIAVAAVVVIAILAAIVSSIIKSASAVTASSDFSAELEDNGFIKGVNALECVNLVDYKQISVPLSEIEYSDESVENDISSTLSSHKILLEESDKTIEDGDTVSIEYVGSVDGVEFDGGNTNGTPTDLTIGSGSYIDDFEQQLIGAAIGDEVQVDVTFPEEYGVEELNGKDAVFMVTIDGIYETPEFTDEFVEENLSEYASTTDEYRQYLKDTNYKTNLRSWVTDYLTANSSAKSYPKAYLKNLKQTQKYTDQNSFTYMNQLSLSYYGSNMYETFEDYVGMSESDYDKSLDESCKETELTDMVYQAILENEGISVTEEEYRAYLTEKNGSDESFNTMVENNGIGYAMKSFVREKAIDIAVENAVVQ